MKKNYVRLIFLLFLMVGGTCYSQTSTVSKPSGSDVNKSSESWISNGENLKGRWWMRNPRKYQPLPNPLLYHIVGHYSFSDGGGNIESKKHRGNIVLTLRKGLFTSITRYRIRKTDLYKSLVEKQIDIIDRFFRQGFRFAITDQMSAVVGKAWEKSSAKYIENRDTFYAGLRLTPLDTPKLNLMFAGFYGINSVSFMNSEIQSKKKYQDFPSVEEFESDSLELHQKLHWQITDKISFSNTTEYRIFLEDTDSYYWGIDAKLEFKQTKRISFFLHYAVDYDDNKFIEGVHSYFEQRRALGKPAGDMEKTNTEFGLGIKFTF